MRLASISSSLWASSFAWLLLALVLPSLVQSAATSSDKATHDGLRKLTAANFTLTNEGAWLIEFFSPNCIHCKKFGATWSELSQNKDNLRTQYPKAPFTLAQVDCLAQWDLCKEQGVTFLPRLTIYQDGKQHEEEYKGDRNYPEISAYIDKFAKEYRVSKGVADEPSVPAADTKDKTTDTAPAVQDGNGTDPASPPAQSEAAAAAAAVKAAIDNAASAVANGTTSATSAVEAVQEILPSGPNPKGELLSFGKSPISTKEELQAWLDKSSGQGPSFVKFFAPWCPHCKAMAAAYKQLSESLKGRVNALEVDCEANRALCADYNIRGYPTLRLYDQGNVKEYSGGRNYDSMLKWVLKAVSSSGLKPVASSTDLAALAKDNEVLFLYLHSPGTPVEEVQAIEAASQVISGGNAPIFTSTEPALLERYASSLSQDRSASVPATSGLLVFKDHSISQPVSVLYPSTLRSSDATGQAVFNDDAKTKISSFLSREKYALVTELTAANFEETIRNTENALVVLAALSDTNHGGQAASTPAEGITLRDTEISALRSVALEWRQKKAASSTRQVIFAWIDADRWKSPLSKLYGIKAEDAPGLVLVDGNKSQYYELALASSTASSSAVFEQQGWVSAEGVFASLDRVFSGAEKPRSSRSLLQKSVKGAEVYMGALMDACVNHPIASFGFVFVLMGALFFYLGRTKKTSASSLPLYSKVATVKAD